MELFSLQSFDFDMYSYSGFTLLYEQMKNISESQVKDNHILVVSLRLSFCIWNFIFIET
jgi:hypothetical protein